MTLVPGIDAAVAAAVAVVVVDGVRTKSSQTTSYQCDRLDCGTVQSVDRGSASVVPKIPSREPVFQRPWCLATSWAVGVNCVVHQMFVCLKADTVSGSQLS